MLNWFFVMIWKKEVKRTDDHCVFFDLGSDWDFLILTLCLILASGASQKNLIVKKWKQPLDHLSYPSNLHTGPHLWQISGGGGVQTMPLLPMLEKEVHAQFYRDKNMWRNAARDRVLLNDYNNSGVT